MSPELKKLLVAPIYGGMLVLFLPLVVWFLLGEAIWVHLSKKFHDATAPLPMAGGIAYFAGKGEDGSSTNIKLDGLADEIARKR